jgi:hypothetical protein
MNLQDEIKKLTEKERKRVAILSGWTILHLILYLISNGSKKNFWPLEETLDIKADYDFSEFVVYGLIPWVILIVYRFLMNSKNN